MFERYTINIAFCMLTYSHKGVLWVQLAISQGDEVVIKHGKGGVRLALLASSHLA